MHAVVPEASIFCCARFYFKQCLIDTLLIRISVLV
jgi:hypothetical protein